ncbi:unnamed protein product [Rotaria magnacalcarata]|uniref:Uncharacterized protein n=1 Tax=Rotaria magnacalcarata TaxID=392030 RepID=A0A820H170_9BILA|nr:unnamed protein product [Rotaria magnacalcarata]CAF4287694.1 unnamed protein product [Rotaria magnacalcarata]
MSDQSTNQGHWETHSYASKTNKIGDNPPIISGKETMAEANISNNRLVSFPYNDIDLFDNENTINFYFS